MEKKFRKGEIVWAKVRGFPWWPAMVKSVNVGRRQEEKEASDSESREVSVVAYFIGDDTHSELPLNKIEKFASKMEEFSRTKKRSLLTSIALAKKILSGDIPFDKHLQHARKKSLKNSSNSDDEEEKDLPEDKSRKNRQEKNYDKNSADSKSDKKLQSDKDEEFTSTSRSKPKLMLGRKRKLEQLIRRKNIKMGKKSKQQELNEEPEEGESPKLNKIGSMSPTQIDFKVKEDLSKNIKINININVNNNTNNTLNITTFSKKKVIDDSEDILDKPSRESSESDDDDPISTLKMLIDSLIFYKIDMPATSRDKSILNSLDIIQRKLGAFKNCNVYNLTNNLVSILCSFLSHRNPSISTKSNEVITTLREKVLSELFEFENVKEDMDKLLRSEVNLEEDHLTKLKDDFDNLTDGKIQLRKTKSRLSNESIVRKESDLTRRDSTSRRRNEEDKLLKEIEASERSESIQSKKSSKENSTFLQAISKNSIPTFNDGQIKLLFKDFISDDPKDISHLDFKYKLENGIYGEEFYQTVYNKFNGLSESLANKRKHVCLKLLNILKLILPEIDMDTLKKTIIFLEYSIRTKDPTLGNIYRKKLEGFYDRIKEILTLTTESLNMNKINNININVKNSAR